MLTVMEHRDANVDAGMVARFEMLACAAGHAIMEIYEQGIDVRSKADRTPVTLADERAEAIILAGLRSTYPDIVCVSEEEVCAGKGPAVLGSRFFLVDPLDGTREFIDRRPEFTVNIALVEDGQPVVGVVYLPATGLIYSGRPGRADRGSVNRQFQLCDRHEIMAVLPVDPIRILCSRSHRTAETAGFIARYDDAVTEAVGSSLKFCRLAEGSADLYPRLGQTMQWDTAAGDAVLRAAGGATLCLDGSPLSYGKHAQHGAIDYVNPHFIATGRTRAGTQMVDVEPMA